MNIKLSKDKYTTIILMPFFKTKENLYYVASQVWLFEAPPEIFVFAVPSSVSDAPGVEELIPFILLGVYYQSQASRSVLIRVSWNHGSAIFFLGGLSQISDGHCIALGIIHFQGLCSANDVLMGCANGCFNLVSD